MALFKPQRKTSSGMEDLDIDAATLDGHSASEFALKTDLSAYDVAKNIANTLNNSGVVQGDGTLKAKYDGSGNEITNTYLPKAGGEISGTLKQTAGNLNAYSDLSYHNEYITLTSNAASSNVQLKFKTGSRNGNKSEEVAFVTDLPSNATTSKAGLMSSTDKTNLDTLSNLLGDDSDAVVNKINEVIEIFDSYPEGDKIADALAGKQSKVAALGSTTKPVYVSADGTFAAASTYAGGTKVTLNGTDKGASTATIYAPTAVGTSGQILKSNGSGAPTWVAQSALTVGYASSAGSATAATTAQYATNDQLGNNIKDTYATKAELAKLPNTDTWRVISVNGATIFGGATNTAGLNLQAGDNVSISATKGSPNVTIAVKDTVALKEDLADYLPLSGGIMTGDIIFDKNKAEGIRVASYNTSGKEQLNQVILTSDTTQTIVGNKQQDNVKLLGSDAPVWNDGTNEHTILTSKGGTITGDLTITYDSEGNGGSFYSSYIGMTDGEYSYGCWYADEGIYLGTGDEAQFYPYGLIFNGDNSSIKLNGSNSNIFLQTGCGLVANAGRNAFGFDDAGYPTILNHDGRYLQIATDNLTGNYENYLFTEYSGCVPVTVSQGTSGQVLTSNGNGTYKWSTLTSGGTSGGSISLEFTLLDDVTLDFAEEGEQSLGIDFESFGCSEYMFWVENPDENTVQCFDEYSANFLTLGANNVITLKKAGNYWIGQNTGDYNFDGTQSTIRASTVILDAGSNLRFGNITASGYIMVKIFGRG